jgi:hypothetical protein
VILHSWSRRGGGNESVYRVAERAGDGDEDGSGDDGDNGEEEDVFVDETLDQHIHTIIEFTQVSASAPVG